MEKNKLILISKMLNLAESYFINHGCNDLPDEITNLISDDMLEDMRHWNSEGRDPWPDNAKQVGDDSLMAYLADYCERLAE